MQENLEVFHVTNTYCGENTHLLFEFARDFHLRRFKTLRTELAVLINWALQMILQVRILPLKKIC